MTTVAHRFAVRWDTLDEDEDGVNVVAGSGDAHQSPI
jgi:hypothetical protein